MRSIAILIWMGYQIRLMKDKLHSKIIALCHSIIQECHQINLLAVEMEVVDKLLRQLPRTWCLSSQWEYLNNQWWFNNLVWCRWYNLSQFLNITCLQYHLSNHFSQVWIQDNQLETQICINQLQLRLQAMLVTQLLAKSYNLINKTATILVHHNNHHSIQIKLIQLDLKQQDLHKLVVGTIHWTLQLLVS